MAGSINNMTFAATYTLSLFTNPIDIDVSPVGSGASISTNNVTVVSTCPSGYTLSIQGPSDSTLYKDGNSNNNEGNNSTNYIEASSGTSAEPVSILGDNINTWGYSMNANATVDSNFIGLTNNLVQINTSSTATSDVGVTIPVYYGVSVSENRNAGIYKMSNDGAVTYQLTTSLDCTSYQVQFNANGGSGTMTNQRITEDTATNLVANDFTAPAGAPYFKGWNTVASGTGVSYADQTTVTNLATAGNTIILYAQWTDCPPNNICYYDNGANSDTKMGKQTLTSSEISSGSTKLWSPNFKYDIDSDGYNDYGFLGWSEETDPSIGTDTIYGPMETVENLNLSSTYGLELYAIWKEAKMEGPVDDEKIVYMQDWNGCKDLTQATYDSTTGRMVVFSNSVVALTDERDNQVYAVARLADGNCWMIENLRLDYSHSSNSALTQGFGGVFTGLAEPETADFSDSTTSNSLYSTANITGDNLGFRFPRYNDDNTTNAQTSVNSYAPTGNVYSFGNYYTWAAAMASTVRYGASGYSDTANTSICPKGWRLPYGGNTGSGDTSGGFYYLNRQMGDYSDGTGSKEWRSFPNNFVLPGYYGGTSIQSRGSQGLYYSTTNSGVKVSANLLLSTTAVITGGDGNKYIGKSVRCLAGP